MTDLLEFLAYGAIGIALALAILSYRLLSKEQEKQEVRPVMLKHIRHYFLFTMLLSVFFGVTEIIVQFYGPEDAVSNPFIEEIHNEHLSQFEDNSINKKADRISHYVSLGINRQPENDCSELENKLKEQELQIASLQNGFYPAIAELQRLIFQFGDNNINIDYRPNEKEEVFKLLEKIFVSLGELDNHTVSTKVLQDKWKSFKSRYSATQLKYIYHSDISQIVKAYLVTHDGQRRARS